MFKGLLLAGALVALAPTAAQAAEPFKFEPEKAHAFLVQVVFAECHAKAESQPMPAASPAFGPIVQRQIRQHWESQCIAAGLVGADELVDDFATGRITKGRLKFCWDNTDRTAEVMGSIYRNPWMARVSQCAKTGGLF
jgi:hypothetical protein